ncbi:MAG: hypothetical protein HQL20_11425 [Candidatus Omnitrophica bacterium]|nr:hypothetical protein [Candidatus Omnitrophota bacterium]
MSLNKPQERLSLDLIEGLRNGTLAPDMFSIDERLLCIEVMLRESIRKAEIARMLKVSDRTIRRDQEEIRKRNAIKATPGLAREMIGEFKERSENSHATLSRLARAKETPPAVKVMAEGTAWEMDNKTIKTYQALGVLPSVPQKVVATVYHQEGLVEASYEDMRRQIEEFEANARELGTLTPETQRRLTALRAKINKSEISEGVVELNAASLAEEEVTDA